MLLNWCYFCNQYPKISPMKKILFAFLGLMLLWSCDSKSKKDSLQVGKVTFDILHSVDGKPLIVDSLLYVNGAGNRYEVSEIQWFISDIYVNKADGSRVLVDAENNISYIDTDIESSQVIRPLTPIASGVYSGLSFTFGINEEKNKTMRFVNPPESFMFWPDYLGGGYHYMKLNGKWINPQGQAEPFNFHLGIGQIYDSTATKSNYVNLDSCCSRNHCQGYQPPQKMMPVIGFVHNYFEVQLNQEFIIYDEKTTQLELVMQIEKWFNGQHIYDHNHWGGSIMQQQLAMKMACENGLDVFDLKVKGIENDSK